MAKLSTSAWILHDLGMAAGFGGTLFGKAALDPAVKTISSPEDRGKVLDEAWRRFDKVDLIALALMAATWWPGRKALSGKRLGRSIRALVIAKDVLIGAALLTGIATMIAGAVLHKERQRGALRLKSGYEPIAGAPGRAKAAQRFLNVMGPLNTALVAGVIGVNAALSQESGKSARWSVVSRLLP
jgi:uncharacterized membrane protein